MRKMLRTRADVEGAKPAAKEYRLWDVKVPGLCLRVWPTGVKAFSVTWARNKRRSLGHWPAMTLEAARVQALGVLSDAAVNGEPEIAKEPTDVVTLRDFITDVYRPWAIHEFECGDMACDRIEQVYAELLDVRLDEITGDAVEKIRTRRLAEGLSKSTCNRDLAELKAALQRAVDRNYIAVHPLDAVKLAKLDDNGVVRYLSADEEQRLRKALRLRDDRARAKRESHNEWRASRGRELRDAIAADGFSDHMTPLVLTAINTGLRRGELTKILWSDVDLGGRLLTVRAKIAKSKLTRYVPLNREATDVLTRWRAQQAGTGRVFAIGDPKTAWAALLDLAEISDFRFHDLRHHFASKLVMAGVDLNTVRELLGHADLKMTLRYAHLSPGHKAEAVEALGAKPKRSAAPARPAPADNGPAKEIEHLVDQLGDEKQLRQLLAQLAAKLVAA